MIKQKYETAADKQKEIQLGERYRQYYQPDIELQNLGFLSTYDFIIKKNGENVGFLEVKKKSGYFSTLEMIPITKWNFAVKATIPCYLMVERDSECRLFNITSIINANAGEYREIKRREDQPDGSRKVYFFKSDLGTIIYRLM